MTIGQAAHAWCWICTTVNRYTYVSIKVDYEGELRNIPPTLTAAREVELKTKALSQLNSKCKNYYNGEPQGGLTSFDFLPTRYYRDDRLAYFSISARANCKEGSLWSVKSVNDDNRDSQARSGGELEDSAAASEGNNSSR